MGLERSKQGESIGKSWTIRRYADGDMKVRKVNGVIQKRVLDHRNYKDASRRPELRARRVKGHVNYPDNSKAVHPVDRSRKSSRSNAPRMAVTIVESSKSTDGEYIPVAVIEGEQGYRPLSGRGKGSAPWTWGKDRNHALRTADAYNENLGLTQREAGKIILSSMR